MSKPDYLSFPKTGFVCLAQIIGDHADSSSDSDWPLYVVALGQDRQSTRPNQTWTKNALWVVDRHHQRFFRKHRIPHGGVQVFRTYGNETRGKFS